MNGTVASSGTCQAITSDVVSRRADLWIVRGQVIKAVVRGIVRHDFVGVAKPLDGSTMGEFLMGVKPFRRPFR